MTRRFHYRGRMPAAPDPAAPLTLRPRSAEVITIVVAVAAALLALDAVLRAGLTGALLLPGLLLLLAVVWALLWAPRVVLHRESLEIRNVWRTHVLPFTAIREVRLGAMLRVDAITADGTEQTLTAWNAPGLRRDNPLRRREAAADGGPRVRMGPEERLRKDQRDSRSAIVVDRVEAWQEHHEAEVGTGRARTRWNLPVIAVLGVTLLLVVLRAVL
ncbi:hypothetical protein GCM10028787_23930 [Brachybacterium horti]